MKEIVVVSGKGGTGKTSLTACFAVLAKRAVVADCDVDAADLHLLLAPRVRERHEFRSGHQAAIREDACTGCGAVCEACRFGAIQPVEPEERYTPLRRRARWPAKDAASACTSARQHAIDFPERVCGEWMVSQTRCGPLVHGRLAAAAENSGRLVSTVRREARRLAEASGADLLLVDGPPGIGCPVIASLTGADLASGRDRAHRLGRARPRARAGARPSLPDCRPPCASTSGTSTPRCVTRRAAARDARYADRGTSPLRPA